MKVPKCRGCGELTWDRICGGPGSHGASVGRRHSDADIRREVAVVTKPRNTPPQLASVTKSRNKADDGFEGEVKALKRALAESNAKLAEALAKIERLEAGKTKAVPAVERMRKMREKRKAKNGTTEFRG